MSAQIKEMDALDLVGRLAINPHGVEFVVTRLSFEAYTASVVIWIDEMDDDGKPIGHECGTQTLDGWTITNRP